MFKKIANNNTVSLSIFLFVFIYGIVVYFIQPAFLYNVNGTIKEFGVGYKHKTVVPMWLFAIVVAILSYLFVIYYITNIG
jgi:hypothetical protein